MLHQKHVASKHVASKCLWSNWVARNPPLVALHCQQHCVQHAIFCHTSKSILDTQRFRRLLCIQPCVWVETLEKVFRTKQPTLHAISSLFPVSPEPCGSESRCVLGGNAILIGGTFMRRLIPMVIRGLGVCFGCRWMMSCFCRALVTSAPKRPDLIDLLFAGTVATKVGGSPHKQSSSAKLHPQAHVCQRSHGSCHHASPVLDCMDAESINFC